MALQGPSWWGLGTVRSLRASLSLLTVLSIASAADASPATAKPSAKPAAKAPAKTALVSKEKSRHAPGKSIGSPTEGHLLGGARIEEGAHLRIVPQYAGTDVRWGLEALVGMLDRAARSVRRRFPDAVLSVGHLSRAGGGELDRHASHESGRDADVAFYVKNHLGKPAFAEHFVPFTGDGTAKTWPGARFDDDRNWAFVASLLEDRAARVSHIFVATPLRARLLAHAAKIGAPAALRQRAAEVMAQPRGSLPHDDHFHVRIECPRGMEKCVEQPTARGKRSRGAARAPVAAATPAKPAPRGAHSPTPAPAHEPEGPRAEATAPKEDISFPSFAQAIPGLDEAVIASPLPGSGPGPKPARAPNDDTPIDDPDGILE